MLRNRLLPRRSPGPSPVMEAPRAPAEWAGYALAVLLGLASVGLTMGNPLAVLNGSLMIDTDYPNAAAAFALFIRDAWHWPLGENPGFELHPESWTPNPTFGVFL